MDGELAKKEHIVYFDYLRAFGVICVVFMHTAAAPLRDSLGSRSWQFTNAFTSLAFTAVPLFLMMAGYLAMNSERTGDYKSVLTHRLPRLLLTLAVWTVVAAAWKTAARMDRSAGVFFSFIGQAFSGPIMVHFWYMYTLIALTLISPVLFLGVKGLSAGGKKTLAVIISLVLAQSAVICLLPAEYRQSRGLDTLSQLKLLGGFLPMYLLGYFLGGIKKKIPNWIIIAVFAADLALIAAGTALRSGAAGEYNASLQAQSGGLMALLAGCVFHFAKQNHNRPCRLQRALSPLVKLSLGIYLAHNLVVGTLGILGWMPLSFPMVCLKTIVSLAISYLGVKTLASIKPLCFAFTGLDYADARQSCAWQYTFSSHFRKNGQ